MDSAAEEWCRLQRKEEERSSWIFLYFCSQMVKAFAVLWKFLLLLYAFDLSLPNNVVGFFFYSFSYTYFAVPPLLWLLPGAIGYWRIGFSFFSVCLARTWRVWACEWFVFIFSLRVHVAPGLLWLCLSSRGKKKKKKPFQNRLWPTSLIKKGHLISGALFHRMFAESVSACSVSCIRGCYSLGFLFMLYLKDTSE